MSSARYVKQVSRPYTKGLSEQGVGSELFSAPITGKKAGKLHGKWRQCLDKKLAITWLGTMCGKTVTASDQGITGKLHHRAPERSRAETSDGPAGATLRQETLEV